MRPRPLLAVLLVVALLGAAPARAQLLVNGNFEAGPAMAPANPVLTLTAGSTALTGWTVAAGAVAVVTDGYWVPLSGQRSVALASGGPGAIEQAFASSPGAVYRLTFWISGEPFSTPTIKHLRVTAGSTIQDFTFDVTPAWHWDMAWAQHTLDFPATGATTTLRLASLDASAWGPAVDSAKVELVSASVAGAPGLSLSPVTPDPVRASGRVAFTLPASGHARLALYDVQGRERVRLADAVYAAGRHEFTFDASVWNASPGLYLAVLEAAGTRQVRRFTLLH